MESAMEKQHEKVVDSNQSYLLSMLHSLWKTRCISLIIELKIPEFLGNIDKPSVSIDEIATKSGCQTSTNLYAVMALLAHWGLGIENENKHFSSNQAMELLRCDKGPSLGHVFGYHTSQEQMNALSLLGECVKQGKPAFVLEHGMSHFAYMFNLEQAYDPSQSSIENIGKANRRRQLAETYSNAVAYYSNLATLPAIPKAMNVYNVYPWSTCQTLVDVAGSLGSFLATILKLPGCEHIQGYLMEFPDVIDEAKSKFKSLGIPEHRIKFIKQNILECFPKDLNVVADTVSCKGTISMYMGDHGAVRKMLNNCQSLFSPKGGRFLIIDHIAPEDQTERVGINGMEIGAQSIHWLSTIGYPFLTKKGWIEQLEKLGIRELGYKFEQFYDTFLGGQAIIELSYKKK